MATDAEIRARGINFLSPQRYLQNPYQFSVAPVSPPAEGGGITNTNAFNNGGSDFSVYNPDPDSIANRNYDPFRYQEATDENFTRPEPTGANKFLGSLTNLIPGKGIAEFLTSYMPPNRRAIMENELSAPGTGIMVNDIGQIVQGGGAYDDASGKNIMAGYNASKIDADTYKKRRDTIEDTIKRKTEANSKYDRSYLDKRLDALDASEENILGTATDRADLIVDFEEEEKEKQKNKTKTFLSKIFKRNKITKAAKNNQDNETTDGEDKTSRTGFTYDTNTTGQASSNQYGKYTPSVTPQESQDNQDRGRGQQDTESQTKSQEGPAYDFARGGRAGYFFGGRAGYKDGYSVQDDMEDFAQNVGKEAAPGGGFVGGDNDGGSETRFKPTVDINKEIQKAIMKKIPTEEAPLISERMKKYLTIKDKNRAGNLDFFRNMKKQKTINKNLFTNDLTKLSVLYPNIDIKNEGGFIDRDKAKALIDRAQIEQTISPIEGLNLTRSIDTTGTQSSTSGDYTLGNFGFTSPNMEQGILNSRANYNLGDLNLNANLNTNDSTINDSKIGFNYGNDTLTGSTYRDNDYGYTTNKLGVDKEFNIGNNFKVGIDGNYKEDKFKGGSYYNSDLTPSIGYNDGTFNANLSKEIVEGNTQPSLGVGFQKNGFYGSANNLFSQEPTGKIGFQYTTGPETYTNKRGTFNKKGLNFTGGFEIDPFTGGKTAAVYGSYPFKNGGLAGLL